MDGKVISLAERRRARRDKANGTYVDESVTVDCRQDEVDPDVPVLVVDTDAWTLEYPMTRDECRDLGHRLLNLAAVPRGVRLRGRTEDGS